MISRIFIMKLNNSYSKNNYMQLHLKGKPNVLFLVFFSFFSFFFTFLLINGWLWNAFVWKHGSREKKEWQIVVRSHTYSYSHSLKSPVQLSCMSLDCGINQEETNINTERTYKTQHRKTPGAAGTPVLHIQNRNILDWWRFFFLQSS